VRTAAQDLRSAVGSRSNHMSRPPSTVTAKATPPGAPELKGRWHGLRDAAVPVITGSITDCRRMVPGGTKDAGQRRVQAAPEEGTAQGIFLSSNTAFRTD